MLPLTLLKTAQLHPVVSDVSLVGAPGRMKQRARLPCGARLRAPHVAIAPSLPSLTPLAFFSKKQTTNSSSS